MADDSNPPPGWYPNPENPADQRYWDGNAWAPTTGAAAAVPSGGAHPGTAAAPPRTEPLAIWSLVASLAGLLCGVGAIVGVVLGHLALGSIKRTGNGGRGLAIAGLIIGYLLILSTIAAVILILVLGDSSSS